MRTASRQIHNLEHQAKDTGSNLPAKDRNSQHRPKDDKVSPRICLSAHGTAGGRIKLSDSLIAGSILAGISIILSVLTIKKDQAKQYIPREFVN